MSEPIRYSNQDCVGFIFQYSKNGDVISWDINDYHAGVKLTTSEDKLQGTSTYAIFKIKLKDKPHE